jgi:phi LC3 family holin
MLNINLKSRLTNKTFWVSLVGAIILLLQQLKLFTLANYIPSNYADIINSIFAILTMLGITVDTSTPGISDQQQTVLQPTTETQTLNDKSIDTSTQNAPQAQIDTSASSKIQVDNPDNVQAINQQVNSTSATTPQ